MGFKSLVEPMLKIEPIGFQAHNLTGVGAVIFTSVNGVRFGPPGALKAYCVGEATAAAAQDKGYEVINAEGDAEALVQVIKNHEADKLLYMRGEQGAFPVAERLKQAGFEVEELVVYRATLTQDLSQACLQAIKNCKIDAVTVFSKRTAENFVRLAEKNGLLQALKGIKLLSISPSVLESVRAYECAGAYAALTPNASGMIRLIKDVC